MRKFNRLTKWIVIAMIPVFSLALAWHVMVGWPLAIAGSLIPLGTAALAIGLDKNV